MLLYNQNPSAFGGILLKDKQPNACCHIERKDVVRKFLRQGARAIRGRALVILSQSQAAGVKVESLNPRWRLTNECCISVSYVFFTFKDSRFVILKKEKCLGSAYNCIECNHSYITKTKPEQCNRSKRKRRLNKATLV